MTHVKLIQSDTGHFYANSLPSTGIVCRLEGKSMGLSMAISTDTKLQGTNVELNT